MIYFIADAHLGSRLVKDRRKARNAACKLARQGKKRCRTIYMLGDMFDFWFEYKPLYPADLPDFG